MPNDERLLTIRNDDTEDIIDSFDGVTYTFSPGKPVTLAFGLGVHFKERHNRLVVVGESRGLPPETVYVEVLVKNMGKQDITVAWDGRSYSFPAGQTVPIERSLAPTLIIQSRTLVDDFGHPLDAALVIVEPETPKPEVTPEAPKLEDRPENRPETQPAKPAPKPKSKKKA